MTTVLIRKNRPWMLWLALIITLVLVWRMRVVDESQQPIYPGKILAQPKAANAALQQLHTTIFQLHVRKSYESMADLFALADVKETYVDADRKKAKAQPVIVPPLPFKYIGRWKDQTQLLVLLSMNDEIVSAKVGDILFNQYQVLNITENAQGLAVTFLNQPTHQTQVLQVGKAQDE